MKALKKSVIILIIVIVGIFIPNHILAGDGDGDGDGGGKNNPLAIVSSIPKDGEVVESLDFIKLVFSKNIAYITVRDNNMKCFSLWAGDKQIPVQVILADDQIEREKRHDVLIKPLEPLQPGTTYRVEVSSQLQSKSGVFLGTPDSIVFSVAAKTSPTSASGTETEPTVPGGEEQESITQENEPIIEPAKATDNNEKEVISNRIQEGYPQIEQQAAVAEKTNNTAQNNRTGLIAALFAVLAAGAAVVWFIIKKYIKNH